MSIEVLAEDCGCLVEIQYDYLQITQDLIEAYSLSRDPQNKKIYQAFDAAFRSILNNTSAQTYSDRFTIQDDGSGNAILVYSRPELKDALSILQVTVEGQGLDVDNATKISINTGTDTDNVTFGDAYPGQMVNIIYKKVPA